MATCPGGLILHRDGIIWGCTEDEEREGCRGRDLRHELAPVTCFLWSFGGCSYCGIAL
jgi:hypothetical protein